MKRIRTTTWAAILMALVALLAAGIWFALASGVGVVRAERPAQSTPPIVPADSEPLRSVSVSGQGQASAQPDVAYVRLGVTTQTTSASNALQENSQAMNDLISALRDAGLASADIQTQTVNLYPRYDQQPPNAQQGQPDVIGYTAENIVEARIGNLDNLGEILDAAVQAGGNTIQGIRFDISEGQDLLQQARRAAWNDAQQKAEQLAQLSGAQLGEVLTINETSSQTPSPVRTGLMESAAQAAVPVQPGQQSVSVSLQVTWRLGARQSGSGGQGAAQQVDINLSPVSGPPGTNVTISATGLAPNISVGLGIGVAGSEYQMLKTAETDANGTLTAQVTVPENASAGERWIVVLLPEGDESQTISAPAFNVTQ